MLRNSKFHVYFVFDDNFMVMLMMPPQNDRTQFHSFNKKYKKLKRASRTIQQPPCGGQKKHSATTARSSTSYKKYGRRSAVNKLSKTILLLPKISKKNFATKTLIMKIIMMIVTIIIINKTRIRQPTHVRCLKHFQWFKQLTKSKEKKFSK